MTTTETRALAISFETEGHNAGRIYVALPELYKERAESLPGVRRDNALGRWTVPKTWNSILSLSSMVRELHWKLQPSPELAQWAVGQQKAWAGLTGLAQVVRKAEGDHRPGWYLHQEDGATWLNAFPETGVGRILQDEMGTGKCGTCIKALKDAGVKGPILIVAKESALDQAWAADFHKWAEADYRTVQIVGSITQRRKLIAQLAAGEYDVGIIGHSNLKTHTRFENYDGLKKCIKCGGPRLTTGRTDANGKPLPDVIYHKEVQIVSGEGTVDADHDDEFIALCTHGTCGWTGEWHKTLQGVMTEAMAHARKNSKVSEVSESACQRHLKEFNGMTFNKVIVDEIHLARNAAAQFTQAVWGVTRYASPPVEPFNRWGLTGTPVNGKSEGAWSPLHWIGPENWPTKGSWVDYFCKTTTNWAGYVEIKDIKPERLAEFHATYGAVTRRVLADQVLDLPPILRGGSLERRLTMGTVQARQYKEMAKKLQLAVKEGLITVENAAAQAGRLSMLATGCGYPHPDNRPGQPQKMLLRAPSCKLDAIIADWEEGTYDGGKVGMMFVSSQALVLVRQGLLDKGLLKPTDIVTIAGNLPKNDIDRGIAAFQEGRKKLVMLTYAKGGASITLTKAKFVAAVERSWNPDDNQQGVKRFHRIGSEEHDHITVIDYVVAGTNEVEQLTRLEEKADSIDQITRDRDRLARWFA